ncbi:MAG: hypothetical protein ACQETH_04135 [Candidatus Rifleibacteriota bacterium]
MNKFSNFSFKIYLLFTILSIIITTSQVNAATRNMLPRFPEIILEKGFSSNFIVTDCNASARIYNDTAETNIKLSIRNRSAKTIKSSVKFRVLYPTSNNQIRLKVNGRSIGYNRKSPRHKFTLESDKEISFEISAKTNIKYSVDNIRKSLREEYDNSKKKKKGKKFDLSGLMKLFDRENFGRRFMVGPVASKWGVFPLEFGKVAIKVVVPDNFTLVAQNSEKWQMQKHGDEHSYIFNNIEGFAGSVFLPESDKEDFIKTQKIMTSNEFMH